ncbi:MAG: PilZ domain-containing protein [Motiliproteus sp.]|nr:PilZ domain-containing protein [Motiliproteus sp.]MCW9053678.1 PilZ domain-containing protein [Motiliproteus sp.]
MSSERRRHPRYSTELSALLVLPDGHRMEASTANLSRGGASVVINKRLPAGVHILMELSPPSPPERSVFKLWANTLHSKPLEGDNGYGLGIEFEDTPVHYKQLIMELDPNPQLA